MKILPLWGEKWGYNNVIPRIKKQHLYYPNGKEDLENKIF
jgi:hypothetical protein